ncbi:MAG TPA: hypothetical protein VMS76_02660 [Planctomycetota bacterium]|nr:hypothetical protein [Planctomycetota bacterium]
MRAPEPFQVRLEFVGSRPYALGADLYRSFELFAAECLAPPQRPRHVRALRLVREIVRDGSWRLGPAAPEPSTEVSATPAATPAATLDFEDHEGAEHRALFVEDGEPIASRVPDRATRVARLEPAGDFAGSAALMPLATSSDLLYALVEVNKALHVATLRARGERSDHLRFAYVEELPVLEGGQSLAPRVEFRHLGSRRAGGLLYTLNAASTPLARSPVRICYAAALGERRSGA